LLEQGWLFWEPPNLSSHTMISLVLWNSYQFALQNGMVNQKFSFVYISYETLKHKGHVLWNNAMWWWAKWHISELKQSDMLQSTRVHSFNYCFVTQYRVRFVTFISKLTSAIGPMCLHKFFFWIQSCENCMFFLFSHK